VLVEPLRGSRLVDDLLAGRPAAAAFYAGHPRDPAALRRKLEETAARFDRRARERAAAALRPASPGAEERLRRFVEEGGAMVTTGQQAGLFTGPLYTVHKILTAIRLAEALERELGTVVLPVFWAASEDHDFVEVRHAEAVTHLGELRTVSVAATSPVPVPVGEMRLGNDVDSALDEFLQTLGISADLSTHFKQNLLADYRPGVTVGDAFVGAILRLFADFDLCVTHAADEALKRASARVLLGDLERAEEHERLLVGQSERMAAAGYPPQAVVMEGGTNVFYHGPAGRERLYVERGGFVAKDSRRHFKLDDLRRLLEDNPKALSPNVFLRPVVESAVFPTLAYVGGPAETVYFGQTRPLFETFGIGMPLVFPRFAATIVPPEAEAARAEAGVEAGELARPEHELWERVARLHLPAEVWESVAGLRTALVGGFGRVIDAAHGIDPNLDLAVGARRDRALLEVAKAERKIVRHFKKRRPELARALRLARSHLRPLGLPQERVLTVFQYLPREPRLLHRLAEGMTVELRSGEPEPASEEPEELAPAG
jgi:bacillithiol biosynthesis cysteine-adding enzyme BshC